MRSVRLLLLGSAVCAAAVLALWRGNHRAAPESVFRVERGTLEIWHPLPGRLEAAEPLSLRSEMDGLAKLTWIIEDGTPVEAGEVLARFDPTALEEQRIQLERDLALAETEARILREARHPLEAAAIRRELAEAEELLARESLLLADMRELVAEALVAAGEAEAQAARVRRLEENLAQLRTQLDITVRILHPALEAQADARLRAAQSALARIDRRLADATLLAPRAGTVTLPWIPIDGERRPVRVGDGLFKNQVFLELADLTRLSLRADLREQDLPACPPGAPARVRFPTLPGRVFNAVVVSASPRPRAADRVYPAELRLDTPDPALRPGLSAHIEVLALRQENALLIRRAALRFTPEGAETLVLRGGNWELTRFQPGPGNSTHVTVLSGLSEGLTVRAP